jgi:membrane protease YdiL (CAAX protease family)
MRVFWTAEDLAVWIGLALPSLLLGALLARVIPGAQTPRQLVAQFLFYLVWFLLLKLLLQLKYGERFWWSLGWVTPEKGLWVCLLIGPVLAVGLNLLAQAMKAQPADPPFQDLLFDRRMRFVFGVVSVLAGPLCEELAFRGFLLPLLAKWLGVAGGIFLTGAAFACAHGPQYKWMWQYVLLLTVAGAVFGWARWRYSSTMSAMVVHSSFNLTVFLAHLYG